MCIKECCIELEWFSPLKQYLMNKMCIFGFHFHFSSECLLTWLVFSFALSLRNEYIGNQNLLRIRNWIRSGRRKFHLGCLMHQYQQEVQKVRSGRWGAMVIWTPGPLILSNVWGESIADLLFLGSEHNFLLQHLLIRNNDIKLRFSGQAAIDSVLRVSPADSRQVWNQRYY